MKTIATLFIAAALSAATTCFAQDQILGNVSDPSTELMAHDFRYVGKYKGYHYGLYNAGYKTTKERPGNLDIDLKISKWKTEELDRIEFIHVALAGDTPSDFWRAPYDPTGYIEGSKLHILYCPSVDSCCTYVGRTFDLDKQSFDGQARILTIDGKPMNLKNVLDLYNSKAKVSCDNVLDGGPIQYMGLGMNVEIVKGKGCWYCCLSEVGSNFTSIVVKTTDFYNWESVAIPDVAESYPGDSFWEAVVHPVKGDTYAYAMRFQTVTGGVCYGTWNSKTGNFANLKDIPESFIARPAFFDYKGDTYLCSNVWGNSTIEGYGTVWRATCRFYRISRKDFSLIPVKTKFVPEGIHYYTFYTENGKLYMLYSTDTRRLDCDEARSNIAIAKITL